MYMPCFLQEMMRIIGRFLADDANQLNLVGVALRGPKKAVDKAIKGLSLHQ